MVPELVVHPTAHEGLLVHVLTSFVLAFAFTLAPTVLRPMVFSFPVLAFPFGLAFLPHRVGGASRGLSLIAPAAILSAALFDENAKRRSTTPRSTRPLQSRRSGPLEPFASICALPERESFPTVHKLPNCREHAQCHIRAMMLDRWLCAISATPHFQTRLLHIALLYSRLVSRMPPSKCKTECRNGCVLGLCPAHQPSSPNLASYDVTRSLFVEFTAKMRRRCRAAHRRGSSMPLPNSAKSSSLSLLPFILIGCPMSFGSTMTSLLPSIVRINADLVRKLRLEATDPARKTSALE